MIGPSEFLAPTGVASAGGQQGHDNSNEDQIHHKRFSIQNISPAQYAVAGIRG